ncbi:hypothetical protein AB835_08835 [Candidatus Endobugula sertula]|uniref:OmpA-like domain-containing protein n=1 Tax=Candidatus Endobugula sertula TaxID=62101 RepID=A0A1D2QPD6_9GAMM|nr:hypothetical protein AB835_08835 [Candidatus Endobugula sertula]
MTTKRISLAAIALTSVLISAGASAHVSGGVLVSNSNGKAVLDGAGACIKVTDGSYDDKCHPKPKAKPAPAPQPAPVPEVQKIMLSSDTLFDTDSDVIKKNGKTALKELVVHIKLLSDAKINIVGHADDRGSDSYNQALSERRATSVKNYLVNRGVDASSMTTSGKGESFPIEPNTTKAGRQKNRRVEISITGIKK